MKKFNSLSLVLFFILILIGCNQKEELLGRWERIGDRYNGLQIDIIKEGESFKATIIKVPDSCKLDGFFIGDVKWKNIMKTEANKYEFEDLMKIQFASNTFDSKYDLTYLELVNKNEIKTRGFSKGLEDIGTEQSWKRITTK